MPTTTNYGWTTPADTDLVKDGASAIRTLGSSADTTVKNLNPGTTAGDLDYYTAATTKARIAIGSAGQVLTVASGIPSWATPAAGGGMTLLSTTTLSGASTTISSISGSYKSLVAYIYSVNLASDGRPEIRPNNTNNVNAIINYSEDGNPYASGTNNGPITQPGTMVQNNANNAWTLIIDNYASSTSYKPYQYYGQYEWSAWTSALNNAGSYQSNTAITSLVFTQTGGNFTSGTVKLYGVN